MNEIAESQKRLYMITQIEKGDELLLFEELVESETPSIQRIKIITDQEAEAELLKRLKRLMLDYLKGRVKYVSPALSFSRLILSIFTGISTFMFTAFVIPDPIILIDELIIAALAGGGVYSFVAEPLILKIFPKMGKTMKEELFYNEMLNRIEVVPSEALSSLNRIYESFFEVNLEDNMDFESNLDFLKKAVIIFSIKEIAEINYLLTSLDRRYKFSKLKYNTRKYYRVQNRSSLSASRFAFYYLLHLLLIKEKGLL